MKTLKIFWRKHCTLNRLAKNCSIYLYTSGKCDNCGHNKKISKKKTKRKYIKNENSKVI